MCSNVLRINLINSTNRQSVSRRVSFPIRANHKSSFLYVEQTTYKYVEELEAPKKWFEANIQTILTIYGKEHRLQKEDVYLSKCFVLSVCLVPDSRSV